MFIKKAGPGAITKATMFSAIELFLRQDKLLWNNVKGYVVMSIKDRVPKYGQYEGVAVNIIAIPFLSIKFYCRDNNWLATSAFDINTPRVILEEKLSYFNSVKSIKSREEIYTVDVIWLANKKIETTMLRFEVQERFFTQFFEPDTLKDFSFKHFKVVDLV